MINVDKLRKEKVAILTIGSYPTIIQSILDFDYSAGKSSPSIKCILAAGRKYERYFFGKKEILIPVFPSFEKMSRELLESITYFVNLSSGRRVLTSTIEAIDKLPNLLGGDIFAEDVPEAHALEIREYCRSKNVFVVGPASVGFLIPEVIKLGAIGGVDHKQIVNAKLLEQGKIAVFSASGGMTNEIINIVTGTGHRVSFAFSFGGDRFPAATPRDAFEAAEADPATEGVVYFGELGGIDEYEIVELVQTGKFTKKAVVYIAGTVAEMFPTSPQFGHAKAMAATERETARAKRDALKAAGIMVAESFGEYVKLIDSLPSSKSSGEKDIIESMDNRRHALIATGLSQDKDGSVEILGEDLLKFSKEHSFAYIVSSMFLGKKIKSAKTEEFVDFILRLLVDHGPYVSGAVNTIITSRAGRDLPSALASGILTIGPRFGGAINQAAENWIAGVANSEKANQFVERFAKEKKYISGIGHRKYRVDVPDPRVAEITSYIEGLAGRYTKFALDVEKVTVAKKGNLILNVDGAIAAVLLDLLSEEEGYSESQMKELVDSEFFNALFVASRSIGFIAHFLDQKRLDEGIFRLEEEHVADASSRE